MLEESCLDCNVPYMRSKKGVKLCVSCNKEIEDSKKGKNTKESKESKEVKK